MLRKVDCLIVPVFIIAWFQNLRTRTPWGHTKPAGSSGSRMSFWRQHWTAVQSTAAWRPTKEHPLGQMYHSGHTWVLKRSLSTRINCFLLWVCWRARWRWKQLYSRVVTDVHREKTSSHKYQALPETAAPQTSGKGRQVEEECTVPMTHTTVAQSVNKVWCWGRGGGYSLMWGFQENDHF